MGSMPFLRVLLLTKLHKSCVASSIAGATSVGMLTAWGSQLRSIWENHNPGIAPNAVAYSSSAARPARKKVRIGFYETLPKTDQGRSSRSRRIMSSDDEEDITGPIISQFRNQVMAKSTPLAKKDKCAQDALSQMDSLSINEIANIFFACGRSGYVHGELFVALASRAMRTQGMMVQMLPGNSRLMFQALALLGKLGDDALAPFTNRHDFCRALAAVTIKQERGRFMDSNEYNLTTTLHCVGVMHKHGLLGKGEAIKLVSALIYRLIAEGRIPRCTPQELANVLYGCAVVGYVGRSELKMVSEQIQCLLVVPRSSLRIINTKFNPPVASSIIWSLGKLGMSDGLRIDTLGEKVLELLSDMTGRELVEVLHGFVSLDYNNKDVLNRLCVEVVKPTRLISLTTQELANLLYAVSRLGYEEDMLGDLVKEITKPKRLVELSRPAVCTVVQSLGQMESLPREIVGPLLEEIMDPRRLEMAREQCDRHLCSFVFGLGLMQRHIHDTTLFTSITWFLDDVRVMSATRDLSCRDVACMAWGLSQLRFYNSWFMDRLAAQFLRAMETQNSERIERDALMFLHSCALLHHHHHKFLSFITKHVEAYAQIMNDVRSVATAIWGLAVLGYLDKGLFAILCSRVLLLGPIDRADSAMQILQGWHAVTKGRRGRKQQNENHFENIVVDLVETAQNVVRDLRQPSGMSQFEIEVVQAMKEFGLVFRQKVIVDEALGMEVDCVVEGTEPIVVEIDGPTHYTTNTHRGGAYQEVGATKFRNRILEDLGYRVVCIPFFVWDGLSKEEQQVYLKDVFQV